MSELSTEGLELDVPEETVRSIMSLYDALSGVEMQDVVDRRFDGDWDKLNDWLAGK